jgi:hypothetical protein
MNSVRNFIEKYRVYIIIAVSIIAIGLAFYQRTSWSRVFTIREVKTESTESSVYVLFEITNNTDKAYKDVYLVYETKDGEKEALVQYTINPREVLECRVSDLDCKVKRIKYK